MIYVFHLVKISLIFIKYELSTVWSKGLARGRFFLDPYGWNIFMILKNSPGTWETLENTYLDLWKNTGPSRASARRAVVSRVIRVQRRYTGRIRHIRSMGLVNFGWIFELFIERYRICMYFSHIEYVLRIHLVKISLIFIKYEPSTERSKGLVHERFFWTHTWWKIVIFHEF